MGRNVLKIVSPDRVLCLLKVEEQVEEAAVRLTFQNRLIAGVSSEAEEENFFDYQLYIYGLNDPNHFMETINQHIGDYIDIEEIAEQQLDIWAETHHIGVFQFEHYKESIRQFEKQDWIKRYQSLAQTYREQQHASIKNQVAWRQLIQKLETFLHKEIENSKAKAAFFAKQQRSTTAQQKVIELAQKVLHLMEQH